MSDTVTSPSASSSPREALETLKLDPDGDLLLEVGGEEDTPRQDILACSATMRRTSPVWRAMLFGGFAESKPPSGLWTVALPVDDPKALCIPLAAVHGRFDLVAKDQGVEATHGVLVVADKYDMVASVMPWAEHWMRAAINQSDREGTRRRDPRLRLLRAAWGLKQRHTYKHLLVSLARDCRLNKVKVEGKEVEQVALPVDGELDMIACGPESLMPLDLEDDLLTYRAREFEKILDEMASFTSELMRVPCYKHSKTGKAKMVGNLWIQIHRKKLYPIWSSTVMSFFTVNEVSDALSDAVQKIPVMAEHGSCLPDGKLKSVSERAEYYKRLPVVPGFAANGPTDEGSGIVEEMA